MEIKKILVVFKTHLDIGFTDFAENVTEKYMNEFIPGASPRNLPDDERTHQGGAVSGEPEGRSCGCRRARRACRRYPGGRRVDPR